ncbi:hypothetical protein [Streptomyces sp. NPDC090029]|uniref:hypothetical protein n=1 Tax=Streptomyces sp. NPDC090029 TaxID=3365924 RepID=UPI003819B498
MHHPCQARLAGWLAMLFGDWNSHRVGTDFAWENYADRAFVANRTYEEADHRRTDVRPDRELLAACYVEIARHAAQYLGRAGALNATAGYRDHPGRPSGPGYCIDRGYLSAELAPALVDFAVCDTPDLRRMSDHLPLMAAFDTDELRTILWRRAEVYVPHDTSLATADEQGPTCT